MRPIAPRIVDRDDRWITLRNRVQIKILRFRSEVRRPLWSTSVNVQTYIVGRPGLDPGTLGVFPECPGSFLSVQICWPHEVECPPTSTEVLSRLNSWLDSWLDQGSFQGQATVEFRETDGEGFELRLGRGSQSSQTIL